MRTSGGRGYEPRPREDGSFVDGVCEAFDAEICQLQGGLRESEYIDER